MVKTEDAHSVEYLTKRIKSLLKEGVSQISIMSEGGDKFQYSYCKKSPKNRGVKYNGEEKEEYLE